VTVVLFFAFAAGALAGALGVVCSRNPVHSALWLVVTLVSVAVLFLLQDADLVAAVQVIVYAGAIVVLFIFVIMLLGVDRDESLAEPLRFRRLTALALGTLVLVEVLLLAGHEWATGASPGAASGRSIRGDNVELVAKVLFTDYLWPFELTSVLLVIAVVGAIVLARRSGQRPDTDDLDEPAAPDPGYAGRPSGERVP
jgi:NADH-quinone oxidoreductase subunit J